VAEQLTGAGPRCNSGATRVGVAGGELGELPGDKAGLLQGLAVAGVQRCGDTTAEQGLYTAEQGGDGARVWGVSHGIGDKGAGGWGILFVERWGILGMWAWHRGSPEISGGCCTSGKKEKRGKGANERGQAVRGRERERACVLR
jgi:hypothetical protein